MPLSMYFGNAKPLPSGRATFEADAHNWQEPHLEHHTRGL
jgi:hypothetical protein